MKINRNNYESFFLDLIEGNLSEIEKKEVLIFLQDHPDLQAEFDAFESIELMPDSFEYDVELQRTLDTGLSKEELAIAYAEGDLSERQKSLVIEKAANDSEFNLLLTSFSKLKLVPKETTDFAKEEIKAIDINDENSEELLMAYAEDMLSKHHSHQVESSFSQQEIQEAIDLNKRLRLDPDETIVFPLKAELKRREDTKVIPLYAWISSAAAVFLLFFFLFRDDKGIEIVHSNIDDEQKERVELVQNEVEESSSFTNEEQETNTENVLDQADHDAPVIVKVNNPSERVDSKSNPPKVKENIPFSRVPENLALENQEESPSIEIDIPKQVQLPEHQLPEIVNDESIADHPTNDVENQSEPDAISTGSSKVLNIINVLEDATENSELISFQSNVNEEALYNETSFSIGKFKFKRKAKRKNRS